MRDYHSKILHHEFAEENMEDAITYMEALIQDKPYSPSELDEYSFSVMGWIHRLGNCFKSLEHTRVYLSHFRSNRLYKEAGIVRANYINYHYAKYVVTIITIMDVCLILTNDIFRLGYPERLCNHDNIINNTWIISSGTNKALNKIKKIVEPWRELRNLFIHRGWDIYRDRLTALEGYEVSIEKGIISKRIPLNRVRSIYESELSEIFKEFDNVEPQLFDAVIELFSKLLPKYISWRQQLQEYSIENQ
jgi:hypothetical protein